MSNPNMNTTSETLGYRESVFTQAAILLDETEHEGDLSLIETALEAGDELLAACERVAKHFKQHSNPAMQGILCDVFNAIAKATKGQP